MNQTSFIAFGLGICLLGIGCQHSLSKTELQHCRLFCEDRQGLYQIISDLFKGTGCHCNSAAFLWLDVGDEDASYQEKLDIEED